MTPAQRTRWAESIRGLALDLGLGEASPQEVDELGLLPAPRRAMRRALAALSQLPHHLLIDHLALPEVTIPQTPITRGDSRALSIAAASILAKVARDQIMDALDDRYPGYGFARHKGYGTAEHRAALRRSGPTPVHRRSYAPVAHALLMQGRSP
jgi:ribonuclease HII